MRYTLLGLLASFWAVSACVTDPMAEKQSSYVKDLRTADGLCRTLLKAKMKEKDGKKAVYYFGKLAREPAKSYAVIYAKDGGAMATICDNDKGKIIDWMNLAKNKAKAFETVYGKRHKESLAGHKSELTMSETASSAVVEVSASGKAVEYWLPKHMEKEFNDIFYDLWK